MRTLFFLLVLLSCGLLTAQRGTVMNNHIGLQASYAYTALATTNFTTAPGRGFLAGLSTRGAFYNDFDLIYGIDFLSTTFDVEASTEKVRYRLSGVQVKLLASYLLAGQNLSIEFGPALQVNGKLRLEDTQQNNQILDGYTSLQAGDLEEITRVNGMLLGGFTAGFESVRVVARYHYNLNNILNRLNQEDLQLKDPAATNFKGNLGMFTAGIVLYL